MSEAEDIAIEIVDLIISGHVTKAKAIALTTQALQTFHSIGAAEGTKMAGDAIMKAFEKAS